MDRRGSARLSPGKMAVKEANGDYFFSYNAKNISEDGIFLEGRQCVSSQEPFSKLTFTLPNGKVLRNLTARIIREDRQGSGKGCAYEFMNLSEETRMELKRFFTGKTLVKVV